MTSRFKFHTVEQYSILSSLNAMDPASPDRDGRYLKEALSGTTLAGENPILEKALQKILVEAINRRSSCNLACFTEIETVDNGRMDVVVYDPLGTLSTEEVLLKSTEKSVQIPGRPTCLIELKRITSSDIPNAFTQSFRYSKTLVGHHAGIGTFPIVLFNGRSFLLGAAVWVNYSTLEYYYCPDEFALDGYYISTSPLFLPYPSL